MHRPRVGGFVSFAAAALVAGCLGAGWAGAAHAQAGMWAIDTNACTPDGTRCIKGLVNDGPPAATRQECEKKMQALLRQYHAANLKVMFIRCVRLR